MEQTTPWQHATYAIVDVGYIQPTEQKYTDVTDYAHHRGVLSYKASSVNNMQSYGETSNPSAIGIQ